MDLCYLVRSGLGIPDYWHPHLQIRDDFLSGEIRRYPLSTEVKADYPGRLNDEGVPSVHLDVGVSVLPVTVALFGLGSHDVYLRTADDRYLHQLTCAVNWLHDHAAPLGDGVGWVNRHGLPDYGLEAPWFSAIVQGFALSLFLRGHLLDGSGPCGDLARRTWRGYHVAVEDGGFRRETPGGIVFEEYPTRRLDFVFNGMCHALIGLWEGWTSGLIPQAEKDFRLGVDALKHYVPSFDHRGWSLYSLNECLGRVFLASPYYHRANALLAQIVGRMAGVAELLTYAERWLRSGKSVIRRIRTSLRIGLDRYLHARSLLHSDISTGS